MIWVTSFGELDTCGSIHGPKLLSRQFLIVNMQSDVYKARRDKKDGSISASFIENTETYVTCHTRSLCFLATSGH